MTLTSSQELALQNGRISRYQIPMDRYPTPFPLQLTEMLTMHTLNPVKDYIDSVPGVYIIYDPVNKSRVVNVSDHEVPM